MKTTILHELILKNVSYYTVYLLLSSYFLYSCAPPLTLNARIMAYMSAVPPPGVMEGHQAKLSFFKVSTCHQMLERLIGHYLPLSEEELQHWEENAEDFGL